MKKYIWLLAIMALILIPLLAACGAAEKPTQAPAPSAPAAPTTPAPTAPVTPAPAATPTGGPPAIPHTLEGRTDCLLCHGASGIKPYPADHAGRTNDLCRACHQPAK